MDKGQLSQSEAARLLAMIKTSAVRSLRFPTFGETKEFEVVGDTKRDLFVVGLYRAKIRKDKYNFGARIRKDGILLLELHIGSSFRHTNPDGTEITGSHWHYYSEQYGRAVAFPAEDIESYRFEKNTLEFFERFNIVDPPDVLYQDQLSL